MAPSAQYSAEEAMLLISASQLGAWEQSYYATTLPSSVVYRHHDATTPKQEKLSAAIGTIQQVCLMAPNINFTVRPD